MVEPAILALAIPILAIVGVFAVVLMRMWTHHRERMAMIEMGIDPDAAERDEVERLEAGERLPGPRAGSREAR
jgi:hypothetical protein